jgi:hypothetical protein
MTDDNIIDISGELAQRWRRRLPEYYLKHVDLLKSHHDLIETMQKCLRAIHGELASKAGELEAEAEAHFADCKTKVGEPGECASTTRIIRPKPTRQGTGRMRRSRSQKRWCSWNAAR